MSFIFGKQHHGAAATASSLKERFLNSCCCCCSSREMNVRTVGRYCFTSSFGWLILTCGALYFVYFAQLMVVVSPTTSDQQQQQLPASIGNHLLAIDSSSTQQQVVVDRSRCCVVMSGRQQQQTADVCGRPNCTRNCPDVIPLPVDDSRANAFFLETSGSGGLNIRQACAVESLAFHNPNLNVNVLFMMDDHVAGHQQQQKQKQQIKNKSKNKVLLAKTVQQLKEKYRNNIQFATVSLDEFIAGSLLEKWYHCTDWRKGPYHVSHLSDGLRFLTLNKYGGYYFDLDVLMVRPVTYYSNFVASPDDYNVASNSIHADLNNPVMELALKNFVANYRADIWAHNGPALLLRVLKKWCNTSDVASMNYVRCKGFHVLPRPTFNPVHFSNWDELFVQQQRSTIKETSTTGTPKWLTDQVIGVHTCNKMSNGGLLFKNSTQGYIRLARQHCPRIFSIAPETF